MGWATIAANGLAGVYALVAWRRPRWRGRPVWVTVIAAQVVLAVQVTLGAILENDEAIAAPRIHMFYGFVGLIIAALAYSYRLSMRDRLEMYFGFVALLIMGVGVRAVVTA